MKILAPTEWHDSLAARRGARVKVWQFSATLSRCALQVRAANDAVELYVVGVSCQFMTGPMSWDENHVQILEEPDAALGTSHVVRDAVAGFELWCSGVVLVLAAMSEFDLDADALP